MCLCKINFVVLSMYILITISSPSDYSPDNYKDLVQSPYFIDKTLMIKKFFDNLEAVNHTLITYPQKFGKTWNLKMIKFFAQLEVNESKMAIDAEHSQAYQVFKNLHIGQHKDFMNAHLAQYPVLYLDLGNVLVNATNPSKILSNLRKQMSICCREYLYVYEHMQKLSMNKQLKIIGGRKLLLNLHRIIYGIPTRGEMRKCLLRMTELLYFYFGRKVIVIVDDLSGSASYAYLFRMFLEREMFRFMVPGMLKEFYMFNSPFIHSILITGHSSLGLPSYYYKFPKFREYSFLENHRYSEFYGFTEQHTQVLFDRFKITEQNRTRFKNYYQGYATRNASLTLYNPCWVITYLQSHRFVLTSPDFVHYNDVKAPENIYLYGFMYNNDFRQKITELIEYKAAITFKKQYEPAYREKFLFYKFYRRVGVNLPITEMFTYLFERGYLTHTASENEYTAVNAIARQPLLQMLFLYYSKNFELFDTMKEGINRVLSDPGKSSLNNLRQLKFWFDNILEKILKEKYPSLEDEFHIVLLASVAPTGNQLNDDNLRLKTAGSNKISFYKPNIVLLNSEQGFASVIIVRFNSSSSVSQIMEQAENPRNYHNQNIKIKKMLIVRVNEKYETTIDEKIEEVMN